MENVVDEKSCLYLPKINYFPLLFGAKAILKVVTLAKELQIGKISHPWFCGKTQFFHLLLHSFVREVTLWKAQDNAFKNFPSGLLDSIVLVDLI